MKKLIYLPILILIFSFQSCSDKKDAPKNVDISMFPDAESVFLNLEKEFTLNEDGSSEYHETKSIKLLSYKSFNNLYGETFIVYNPDFQTLKINTSKTEQENGNIVEAPENAFNIVLPAFAAKFPYANKIHEMVATHTGLEKNAIINFDYTLKSKKGFIPGISFSEVLNQSSPIKNLKIVVNIPEKENLNFELLNSSVKPEMTTGNGKKTYTWIFTDIPEYSIENFQNPANQLLLIFNTSTVEKQRDIFVSQSAFTSQADQLLKNKTLESVKDCKDQNEKIIKLQNEVVNNLVLKDVPLKFLNFTIRPIESVWKNNIATPAEKAILLSKMLEICEIPNQIISVLPTYGIKAQSLNNIEDYYILIKNPEPIHISPVRINSNNLTTEIDGKNILNLSTKESSFHNNLSATKTIEATGNFMFANDKSIKGNISASFSNYANPYLKLIADKEFALTLFPVQGKNTIETNTSTLSKINYAVEQKSAFRERAHYLFWTIPYSNSGLASMHLELLNTKRQTVLELPNTLKETYKYTVELGTKFKPAIQAVSLEKKYAFGSYSLKITPNGNKITIEKSVEITKKRIEVNEYADFREMINNLSIEKYKELCFKTI